MELKLLIMSMVFLLWTRYLISAANQKNCFVSVICDNGPAWINFTAWNQEQLKKSLNKKFSNVIEQMKAKVVSLKGRLDRLQKARRDREIANQTTVGIPSTSNTVTTTSIINTFGTEVPSSTTVLSSPTMTRTTENPGANPSSTTVFSSPSQTQTTEKPGEKAQGVPTNVNVTAKYGITSCPPYCGSINEASYINHTWCVVKQNHCKCNGSILELEKYSTETAHVCMKPLQKDCPSTCEFYVKNSQFFNSSTVYPTISAPGLRNVICECANGSESGLPSTYGWLIIQRRLLNGTAFKESSTIVDYEKSRVGKTHYWLGLKRIYTLASDNASLQIEFGKRNSTGVVEYFFVRYSHFSIGNKSTNYRLNVIEQPHCGNDTDRLPDYLDPKSVRPVFAVRSGSGWWFYNNSGLDFNLNAEWNNGIRWGNQTYDTVVMKILPGGAEKGDDGIQAKDIACGTSVRGTPSLFQTPVTAVRCPAGCLSSGSIWGSEIYTHDSKVCRAAIHNGKITNSEGGIVFVKKLPGQNSYASTTSNGITTRSYGNWLGSYRFCQSTQC